MLKMLKTMLKTQLTKREMRPMMLTKRKTI
jgi:hypothetical protein